MDILKWAIEASQTAGPVAAGIFLGVGIIVARVLWMRHVRDIEDLKALVRAQTRAQEADAKSKAKLAGALGELSAKLSVSRRRSSGR